MHLLERVFRLSEFEADVRMELTALTSPRS
jgi:hypothetical protein